MRTVQEFQLQLGEDSPCATQLNRQRWPKGFGCPSCQGPSRGSLACRQVHECAYRYSMMAPDKKGILAVEGKHLKGYVANYTLNRRFMEPDLLQRLLRTILGTETVPCKQLIAATEQNG